MFPIFFIILVATLGLAHFAWRRYEEALKAGAIHTVPGGQTAGEAAREFLDFYGAEKVTILEHNALVTDYYDPKRKCLFLSKRIRDGIDAGSWAVALHEAAHALQGGDSEKAYAWRFGNIRLTRYAPTLVAVVCLILMVIKRMPFNRVLIVCSALCAMIMLVNMLSIPVEFNASQRVMSWIERKLKRHQSLIDAFAVLLPRVAWRDTGVFIKSPVYFFYGMLPMGGKLRPNQKTPPKR
ncbi:MAG: zinc metallopeptidase [Verrucomicrobium sp.]|nr:zinc metallopeptidase [Verrucomicrobium sp.]